MPPPAANIESEKLPVVDGAFEGMPYSTAHGKPVTWPDDGKTLVVVVCVWVEDVVEPHAAKLAPARKVAIDFQDLLRFTSTSTKIIKKSFTLNPPKI